MKKFHKIFATFLAVCMCFSIFALTACGNESGTVTITYDTGVAGLAIEPTKSEPGKKIYPPADPEREGYRFEGWSLDGELFTFTVMPSKSITLKAVWNKLYSVTFVVGEGADPIEPQYYTENEELELPVPERGGYKFTGWTLDGDPFEAEEMPARDIVLTAEWEKAVTITFNTGVPGFTIRPIVEPAGTKISAPFVNRPGYHLLYWKLNDVRYEFKTMPNQNITLDAVWSEELTNLPALFIDLSDGNGNTVNLNNVTKEAYVNSTISLSNTEDEYILSSLKSEFKGRGNGSWSGDKRGYKIKFDKKQSLFGREANKHWVIIACNNFDDPTMSRNYLAYNMAGEVFDNIEYSTNAVWIDVYVNGEYRGVYLLCEHVRVGTGRVDIESEYMDSSRDPEDTGYLIEYDAYATGELGIDYFRIDGVKHGFTMHSPDPEDYVEEGFGEGAYIKQVKYIQKYVADVYDAALRKDFAKFSELADVESFVDMYILHELFKNMDTGFSSFYLYKKPNGKLYAGPPWDFDGTTNADDGAGRGNRSPQGLYVAKGDEGLPETKSELYIALYQTSGFLNAVKARWKTLSPEITSYLNKAMNNTVYTANKAAMGKNYAKWNYKSQTAAENDWVTAMETLKKWLVDRIAWLDNEWK